jgi:hypothetical protein
MITSIINSFLMIQKVRLLSILLFLLAFGFTVDAQSLQQTQNGTITVLVACNCQLITEKSNQPLHFMACGKNQRDSKHLRINSNCAWNLRVVTNKRDNDCNNDNDRDRDKKKDNNKNWNWNENNSLISYSLKNIRGKGKLLNPSERYVLGSSLQNLPSGIGELEFDVVFEKEGKDQKKSKWGEENTWVSFYVLPKE